MQSKEQMSGFVVELLGNHLPAHYYYHNVAHTLYVQEKVLQIGKHENCTEKELELLSIAALWHDTGYINTYAGHEEASCELAKKYLPDYGCSAEDIDAVCGMIMATKIPQSPKNKTEEIIADADLEYLGTINAAEKAADLFKELHSLIPSLTREAWQNIQISFIQSHHYFTGYCQEFKEASKQAYLNQLSGTTGSSNDVY